MLQIKDKVCACASTKSSGYKGLLLAHEVQLNTVLIFSNFLIDIFFLPSLMHLLPLLSWLVSRSSAHFVTHQTRIFPPNLESCVC